MKKILLIIIIGTLLLACSEEDLKLTNPNEPGLDAMATESGFIRLAYGVWVPMRDNTYWWFVVTDHNIIGDATATSVGNFAWRWANQPASITIPDGTIVTPPEGGMQSVELRVRNGRDWGTDNIMSHEWFPAYGVIQTANYILENVDNVNFAGSDAEKEVKKNTIKAWAYWWKGFGYSRIGSIYVQGIIVDKYGETNSNYLNYSAIIDEAAENFEAAKTALSAIAEDDDTYLGIIGTLIPQYLQVGKGQIPTPQMWVRNINTYLARNILVNKYASELTTQDLANIQALCSNGIRSTDFIFTTRSAALDDLVYETAWSPYRLMTGVWEVVSERWVQDFKSGDARFTRNVRLRSSVYFNPRGRGIQYGTRWELIPIENGGDYATLTAGLAEIALAGCYEENALMLAEARIRQGGVGVDEGLSYIDAVRLYQNAGLAAVEGTGLTQMQALEELRRERRIGLYINGLAFYDARRWGVLKDVANGGGRTNANVLVTATSIEACTINYNYLERWDLPANETDFNPVPTVSAITELQPK